jgi:hypothetical protein
LETRGRAEGLISYIAGRYAAAVEIGVGHYPDVALRLIERGVKVFATDIRFFSHGPLRIVIDDITEPDVSLYHSVGLMYSLRPPPELVPSMKQTARRIAADLIVQPLAAEFMDGRLMRVGKASFYIWKFHEEG